MRHTVLIATIAAMVGLVGCKSSQHATQADESAVKEGTASQDDAHHHDLEHDHKGQGMHHRFDDAERWAKIFDNPERDAWQKPDEVVAAMQISTGMNVADIGAGTGYFLARLSEAVGADGAVWALDVESSLVEHMKKRAMEAGLTNVVAKVVAPDDPGLESGSVDRILIVNTWHHIGSRTAYGAKLAQALRPSGALYIVDFAPDSERGPPAEHKLSVDRVVEELETAGFVAAVVQESLPDQYIVRATLSGR